MATPLLLIVADRGSLKVFEVETTPNRGQAPRLVESIALTNAHEKFADKYTDQAGAFPTGGTGFQGNSAAERMTAVAEEEMRVFRTIAGHLTRLLEEHSKARWYFAAPSEINGAIIDGLGKNLHARLERNVKRDLTHTPTAELLQHFQPKE